MDRLKRLIEVLGILMEGKFCGYLKINFTQGSLGRIEKFEELRDAALITTAEKKNRKEEKEEKAFSRENNDSITKTGGALRSTALLFLLLPMLAGCAAAGRPRTVRPGDEADIHFLCRLPAGEVVAATDPDAVQQDQPLAGVYRVRSRRDPLPVVIPEPSAVPPRVQERIFEDDIVARLAGTLTGLHEGERRQVTLTAEDIPERTEADYVLRLARVRRWPKEMRMAVGDYQSRMGRAPEIGQPVPSEPAVPGRVEALTEQEAVIRFSAIGGATVHTPFGPGLIKEEADAYTMEIDARPGSLVRSGPLVGRVTEVDDSFIAVDYRNPFGRETLSCDVTVSKIRSPAAGKEEAENK